MINNLYSPYGVGDKIYQQALGIEQELTAVFESINHVKEINQLRVLDAFRKVRFSDIHLQGSTGYGYDDLGREKIEELYSHIFGGDGAYVRIQISSGTQAISLCLFGVLRPQDEILSITGSPYDTLMSTIGEAEVGSHPEQDTVTGVTEGSLRDFHISYSKVELLDSGAFDYEAIKKAIHPKTKMIFIQKSKGYTTRNCLLSSQIKEVILFVKSIRSDLIVMVDNCYGEFVETSEPCSWGADLSAGSLIKNPGGGICPSGGYIVGRKDLVELVASKATALGLGSHVGPSLGFNKTIAQGLFLAPHIVAEAVKGAAFMAKLFQLHGFVVSPQPEQKRGDIVQSICFKSAKDLIKFCQVIQASSPVDSFVTPEPWAMPGYDASVIMAAGAFVQGSSIELSADGPIKPPYLAYVQGGLVYEQVKLGAMVALEALAKGE